MGSSLALWRDGRGRLSAVRIVTLGVLLNPVVLGANQWFIDRLGPRPLNDLIHRTGYWALMFTLVALAVTPLARIARFNSLLDVRRMIGVAAFCYAAAHILLYIADQHFDLWKVASEIVLRLYLTIGFVALLGLTVLAVTSTDGMVRRLGGQRWRRLHQAIYVIALLSIIHFFQQTKLDVTVPVFVAGLFTWLMGYRLIVRHWKVRDALPTWALLALTLAVTAVVVIGEAVGIGLYHRVSPVLVLQTLFDFEATIRPGWQVLAAGLVVVVIDLIRSRWRKAPVRGKPASARP